MIDGERASNQELIRWVKRVNVGVLVLAAILLAVPALGVWWVNRQLPIINTISIDNVRVLGATDLCPGEPLVVAYDFHAQGAGVLVRDWTAWYITPPKTVIFSASRRFILDGPIDQSLVETWHIPQRYHNYETDMMEPLPPGAYRRYLAISSPTRSSVIAIASVGFTIRHDCP